MKPAPPAALVLSLVFASFHSACLAAASSGNSSTSTNHRPDPETLEQCHSKLLPTARAQSCWRLGGKRVDFCPRASQCCRTAVDEYGWIAAAVGWSLWFLTLILLCVGKLMKLAPDEPKDLQA